MVVLAQHVARLRAGCPLGLQGPPAQSHGWPQLLADYWIATSVSGHLNLSIVCPGFLTIWQPACPEWMTERREKVREKETPVSFTPSSQSHAVTPTLVSPASLSILWNGISCSLLEGKNIKEFVEIWKPSQKLCHFLIYVFDGGKVF